MELRSLMKELCTFTTLAICYFDYYYSSNLVGSLPSHAGAASVLITNSLRYYYLCSFSDF